MAKRRAENIEINNDTSNSGVQLRNKRHKNYDEDDDGE